MPLAIIAGLSEGVVRRARDFAPGYAPSTIAGWGLEIIHSRSERGGLSDCWPQVIDLADTAAEDGTHIFAYHPTEDDRDEFEDVEALTFGMGE